MSEQGGQLTRIKGRVPAGSGRLARGRSWGILAACLLTCMIPAGSVLGAGMWPSGGDVLVDARPAFTWPETVDATHYDLMLYRDGVLHWGTIWPGTGSQIEASAWTPDDALPAGAYHWWVRASAPERGPWAGPAAFSVEGEGDPIVHIAIDRFVNLWGQVEGDGDYALGDTVTLSAVPDADYAFDFWADYVAHDRYGYWLEDGLQVASTDAQYSFTAAHDRRLRAFFYDTRSQAPARPSAVDPSDGDTGVWIAPTLTGSAFSDPDADDFHSASHWQVARDAGFADIVWDSGITWDHRTAVTVPPQQLAYQTAYHSRFRYRNQRMRWSDWSEAAAWTTVGPVAIETETLPAGHAGQAYHAGLTATGPVTLQWSVQPIVRAWGANNQFAEFGDEFQTGQIDVPVTLTDALAIAAGSHHSLAAAMDGRAVAWGSNIEGWASIPMETGQSRVPEGLTGVQAVAGGLQHSLALRDDGTVVGWGSGTVPDGLTGVTAVAAGGSRSLALLEDGTVVAWGGGYYDEPVPEDLTDVTAIAVGGIHSLALLGDGTVVAWGGNDWGQCDVPQGLTGVTAIAAGGDHSLALLGDGRVVGWGANQASGYLGGYLGSQMPLIVNQSVPPDGLSNVVAIAAGGYHSLALIDDGSVVAWGWNEDGQCELPGNLGEAVAIAAGARHSLALLSASSQLPPGLVLGEDGTLSGTPVQAGTYRVSLQVTTEQGDVAVREFDIVIDEEADNLLPVIDAAHPEPGLVSIDEGSSLAFTVEAHDPEGVDLTYEWTWNGHVVGGDSPTYTHQAAWGAIGRHVLRCYVSDDLWDRVVFVEWQVDILDLPLEVATEQLPAGEVGRPYGAALEAINGSGFQWSVMPVVLAWGCNLRHQLDVPTNLNGVVSLTAAGSHSLALLDDGTVVGWGTNMDGALDIPSGLSGVTAIDADGNHNLALLEDGTVVAWGLNSQGQTTVPSGLSGVTAVAAGGHHSLALRDNGTVVAWGWNTEGQSTVPSGLSGVTAIAAGSEHSLALREDGTVVTWGASAWGLGTIPAEMSDVTAIAAGGGFSLALLGDGTVRMWGGAGQVPEGLDHVVAIAAGWNHALALLADGSVVMWGDDRDGELLPPRALADVVFIAAGGNHSLALRPAASQLPPGIELAADGTLSGTPAETGTYAVTFVVVNSVGDVAFRKLAIVVEEVVIVTHTLTYTAGEGGRIEGVAVQDIADGENGEAVEAVAEPGFRFVVWSDGLETAFRHDVNVTADIAVEALFEALPVFFMSPADGDVVQTRRPVFTWSATEGATWYHVLLHRNGVEQQSQWVQAQTWTPVVDLPAGDYAWWVRPWGPGIGMGDFMGPADFSVPARRPMTAPLQTGPTGEITETRRPIFAWEAVAHAAWYRVFVQRVGSGAVLDQWTQATTLTPPSDLAAGTYRWWIVAWGPDGYSPWSGAMEFSIPSRAPGAITLIGPQGEQASHDLTYRWEQDANATWYRLWVGRAGVGTWYDGWHAFAGAGTAEVELANHPVGTFSWWLRPWGPDGFGPWSGPVQFTTPSQDPSVPVLVAPLGETFENPPVFAWESERAEWYRLYVQRVGGPVAIDQWTQASHLTPAAALPAGHYAWWIGAWNRVTDRVVWSPRGGFEQVQ